MHYSKYTIKIYIFLENKIERKKRKKARKKERKIINLVLYNLEVSYPLYKVSGVITIA